MNNRELPPNFNKLSKKYSQESRDKTAKEIREKRKTYFSRMRDIRDQIAALDINKIKKIEDIETIKGAIKEVETELEERKSSILKKLFNYQEIRDLGNRETLLESRITKEQNSLEETIRQITELEGNSLDRNELNSSKKILEEFYEQQIQSYPTMQNLEAKEVEGKRIAEEKDKEGQKIENLMEKYNVIFVHGLLHGHTPEGNSLLRGNIEWRTKLDVVLCLAPTLSTSSIKQGDASDSMWCRSGVILKKGSVVMGREGDAGTRATSIGNRESGLGNKDLKDIEQAVRSRGSGAFGYKNYNELVVRDPEIAGLYIYSDPNDPEKTNTDLPPIKIIAKASQELKLPLFVINRKGIFRGRWDEQRKQILPEEQVDFQDIKKSDFQLDENTRIQLQKEIFGDSPFDLREMQDFACINSSARGRELYIKLASVRQKDKLIKLSKREAGEKQPILTRFLAAGTKVTVTMEDGVPSANWVDTKSNKIRSTSLYPIGNSFIHEIYIYIGFHTWRLEQSYSGIKEYIQSMDVTLRKIDRDIAASAGDTVQQKFLTDIMSRLVSHLYGFGIQAQELEDVPAAEAAFGVANKYIAFEEYKKMFDQRLGPNGEMRITPEDLNIRKDKVA